MTNSVQRVRARQQESGSACAFVQLDTHAPILRIRIQYTILRIRTGASVCICVWTRAAHAQLFFRYPFFIFLFFVVLFLLTDVPLPN